MPVIPSHCVAEAVLVPVDGFSSQLSNRVLLIAVPTSLSTSHRSPRNSEVRGGSFTAKQNATWVEKPAKAAGVLKQLWAPKQSHSACVTAKD